MVLLYCSLGCCLDWFDLLFVFVLATCAGLWSLICASCGLRSVGLRGSVWFLGFVYWLGGFGCGFSYLFLARGFRF